MRRTRKIDPKTGSYVMENGAWVWDESGASQIYQRVKTKRGSVPSDPTFGNEFMNRKKMDHNILEVAKRDYAEAVEPIIDDGTIDSFELTVAEVNANDPGRVDYGFIWEAEGEEHSYDGRLAYGTD